MISPTLSLWLMPAAGTIALVGACRAFRCLATASHQRSQAAVTLPILAAIPCVWLAVWHDLFLFDGALGAWTPVPLNPWAVVGLPMLGASAALGLLLLLVPNTARPSAGDVARWLVAGAVAIWACAAGRIGLLDAQLMMLGVFLLWWVDYRPGSNALVGAAPSTPSALADSGTSPSKLGEDGGRRVWAMAAVMGTLGLGWLAGRASDDVRWLPSIVSIVMVHVWLLGLLPVWAARAERRAEGVALAMTGIPTMLCVVIGLGMGAVTLARVIVDAARNIGLARAAGMNDWVGAATEALGSQPYLRGLRSSLPECAVVVMAAAALWLGAMLPADRKNLPRAVRVGLVVVMGSSGGMVAGLAVWQLLHRLKQFADFQ